jgi:hypothetical protein
MNCKLRINLQIRNRRRETIWATAVVQLRRHLIAQLAAAAEMTACLPPMDHFFRCLWQEAPHCPWYLCQHLQQCEKIGSLKCSITTALFIVSALIRANKTYQPFTNQKREN